MADEFDPQALIKRFQERARAVRNRPLPPVEGEERQKFITAAETDFMDFAIIGDAAAVIEDGILKLTVDLRAEET